jgi:hypothetical protein
LNEVYSSEAIIITLDKGLDINDVDELVAAIGLLRGVSDVSVIEADGQDRVMQGKIRALFLQALHEAHLE